jgi:two-component system OmpR family sensor kinase
VSLRARLSILSVALLLALLLVGAGAEYLVLGAYLRHDEASVLRQRINQTVRDLDVRGLPRCPPTRPATPLLAGRLNPARAECIAGALGGAEVSAVILDSSQAVAAHAGQAGQPQLAPEQYRQALAGSPSDYVLTGTSSEEMIAVLQPLRLRGRVVGAVQLSESTMPLHTTQRRLLTVLGLATLALALVAALVTPLLVSRALRPLRRLTRAASALAAGDLDHRVEEPPVTDEVGRLARAFNEMAAAVQRALGVREESEAGMRTFVSDASHELRTPLTTLQGQLDVLGRGAAADRATLRTSLGSMQREVTRMSALVEDLLILTRLESPGTPARQDLVDLDRLVAETVDEQSVRQPNQRVEVDAGVAGEARVLGDREQLRRVIVNLSTNAAKYAPGGTHRWRTRRAGATVSLSLADEGPGIPETVQQRIFDRFYRVGGDAGSAPGSGLGLAIVRSVVEAHGGTVGLASSPQGTTFTISLPAAAG